MDVVRRPSYLPTNSHTFFSEFLFPSFVSADDPQLGKSPVIHLRGKSFQGALPKNTPKVELVDSFEVTVEKRATEIDQRNLLNRKELDLAADLLQEKLSKLSHIVARPPYEVAMLRGRNLIVERRRDEKTHEIVVVCVQLRQRGAAGANDNRSGTAALLELAKSFSQIDPDRTLPLAFFTNE